MVEQKEELKNRANHLIKVSPSYTLKLLSDSIYDLSFFTLVPR